MAIEDLIKDFTVVKIPARYRNMYRVKDGVHYGVHIVWNWTCERFGTPGQTPSGFRWTWDTYNTYYFRDPADAVLFALKWS
jgi:hypothetical protein